MKSLMSATWLVCLIASAAAGPIASQGKRRLADAATDACFANCASQNDACKRVCPVTLSAPCVSACDTQAQTCRQSCQNR
jgi:hypothetical protein